MQVYAAMHGRVRQRVCVRSWKCSRPHISACAYDRFLITVRGERQEGTVEQLAVSHTST